jgi:hypothetical protein
MGLSGCWHGSLSIYLLVTYLSAILHTCHSSTSCSPRSAITAHKLSVYCACKKQKRRHILCISHHVHGQDEDGKAIDAIARGR